MSRKCKVCGKPLKTGRKYCYLHKGYTGQHRAEVNQMSAATSEMVGWIMKIILLGAILYFIYFVIILLAASFILPVVSGIALFYEIRKIRSQGISSLTKTDKIIFAVSIALLLFSVYWWGYFWIKGKTLLA